jgi:hypothetical protein
MILRVRSMTWKSGNLLAVLCALFVSNVAHPQDHSHATASIAGVLNGGSGAILAVHLEPATEDPVRYYDGYEAMLQQDGSFSFTEIPPGDYRLIVDAESQLSMAPPGTGGDQVHRELRGFTAIFPVNMPSGSVHLRSGEHRKGIVIELTDNQVSICGHVTHDIAPGHEWGGTEGPTNIVSADTSITYYQFNSEFGILESGTNVDTDKDGSFRVIGLVPGTYFLKSGSTWYPGTNTFAGAKPIVVGSKPSSTCNIDIQQLAYNFCWVDGKRQLRATSIDGMVHSDPSSDKNRYQINFLERNPYGPSVSIFASSPIIVQPETLTAGQSFHASVCASDYDVVLDQQNQRAGNVWSDAPVQKIIFDQQKATATDGGIAQVKLTPHPMASIQGEVRLENVTRDDFCPNCQAIYVSILREGNGEFQTVDLSKGNHFDFHNVTPGDYQLFVYTTRPDKVFLKSIVAERSNIPGTPFHHCGRQIRPHHGYAERQSCAGDWAHLSRRTPLRALGDRGHAPQSHRFRQSHRRGRRGLHRPAASCDLQQFTGSVHCKDRRRGKFPLCKRSAWGVFAPRS